MDTAEIIVTLGGALAIATVIWFFFLSERRVVSATAAAGGLQEAKVLVRGGYEPSVIEVSAGDRSDSTSTATRPTRARTP